MKNDVSAFVMAALAAGLEPLERVIASPEDWKAYEERLVTHAEALGTAEACDPMDIVVPFPRSFLLFFTLSYGNFADAVKHGQVWRPCLSWL